MTDPTYRTAITPSESNESETPPESSSKEVTQTPSEVEPPFTEYESKNGKPYAVDYFDLGRYWNTGELYTKEIESISTYLQHLVQTGNLGNSIDAARNKLKSLEKMVNIKSDDRKATRVGVIAAHVEFLMKSEDIKKNAAKYGMV